MAKQVLFVFSILSALAVPAFLAPVVVSPTLTSLLSSQDKVNIVLTLRERPTSVLHQINKNNLSHGQKATAVSNHLRALATSSQASILAFLAKDFSLTVTSYWITNQIFVKGATAQIVNHLTHFPEITEISEHKSGPRIIDPIEVSRPAPSRNERLEWGLEIIDVQSVWNAGYNGTNVLVGIIDSGVRYTHEALFARWVGDYGWLDPYFRAPLPDDLEDHGTHCLGTILGQGGIGVAPGARWTACRGFQYSTWDQEGFTACGQFMACPTLHNGTEPDCERAPHLVSNSWGLSPGSVDFEGILEIWDSIGILPVVANGNSFNGNGICNTVLHPAESHLALAVGATDLQDNLAEFSNAGPADDGQLKPQISGPGVDVRSSSADSDDAYSLKSGTSMATPHVAGVVALLLSAEPNLTISEIKQRLYDAATDSIVQQGEVCGGVPDSVYPNNHVGYGRLSAAGTVLQRK